MKLRGKIRNLLPKWCCRTYFGIPHIVWLILVVVYYWWLITKIYQAVDRNNHLNISKEYYEADSIIYDPSSRLCETIHIAMVCSNMRRMTPMLKSLMYHRQNPLHFHLVVDTSVEKKVEVFFRTWDLPDVNWTSYNTDRASILANNALLPANGAVLDTSDRRLAIMLLPDILPMNRYIVLHSDLTILCDVFELWNQFDSMTESQFIGMVEDQGALNRSEVTSWPAMVHYNTGVMLLNLRRLRIKEWINMWQDTFVAVKRNQRIRVDICVINGVIRTDVVYDISCCYNLQMAAILNAKGCYGHDVRNVKVLHWNALIKDGTGYKQRLHRLRLNRLSPDVDYFTNVRDLYGDVQGDKLRHKLHRCDPGPPGEVDDFVEYDNCTIIHAMKKVKLLTHIYYGKFRYLYKHHDVTLVVHLSMDRIQQFERMAGQWEGPISAAIYVAGYEVKEMEEFISFSDTLRERQDIAYHVIFKSELVYYPINYLRNVALENSETPYVFLMDVDFVLSTDIYPQLRTAVKGLENLPKQCLVVAAFETSSRDVATPRTKADLLLQFHNTITPFKTQISKGAGQNSTNYTLWINATEPYAVEWQYHYEPYLVVHRSAPPFDPRFSGFGWNKLSHSMELRIQGYSLEVVPDAFIVHTPHKKSPDRRKYDRNYHKCIIRLRNEFLKDLVQKYNITYKLLHSFTRY